MSARAICFFFTLLAAAIVEARSGTDDGIYSLSQAAAGATVYSRECVLCHGPGLEGTEGGPALAGRAFRDSWQDRSLAAFLKLTRQTMPLTKPAGLSECEYIDVVAFILNRNLYAAGPDELVSDTASLNAITFVEPAGINPVPLVATTTSRGLTTEWLHH